MELKLPLSLASKNDVSHLHRELRLFIDAIMQSALRHDNPIKYPAISAMLRDTARLNQVDLRDQAAAEKLLDALKSLKAHAPVVHISFPRDPGVEVVQKLVNWFRTEVDPRIVIQVGLQPTIAAGVVVRTPSRQYDFSLRKHLYKNQDKLMEALRS